MKILLALSILCNAWLFIILFCKLTISQSKNIRQNNILESISERLKYRAEEVINYVEQKYQGNNGENKRHHAYALLIKDFPDVQQWKIGMAIELAISKLK